MGEISHHEIEAEYRQPSEGEISHKLLKADVVKVIEVNQERPHRHQGQNDDRDNKKGPFGPESESHLGDNIHGDEHHGRESRHRKVFIVAIKGGIPVRAV